VDAGEPVTLVNLTPHPINIYGNRDASEEPEEVIPVSDKGSARVAVIELGTNLSQHSGRYYELVEYGHIENLPQPVPGTDYIVSLVVALAARGRDDLLAPYAEVRDARGTMIGCRFLQRVC
jgi:hypothetical protein